MLARRLGHVTLDEQRVAESLEALQDVTFHHSYQDYALGGWESCSLWNKFGDETDGWSREYTEAAKITAYGRLVPYLQKVAARCFAMEHCKAARVFRIRHGQLAPHRDYLEFDKGFTRIHLVLKTTPLSFNSEEAEVYQMQLGEVWYVDGAPVHSAASFADEARVHLVFDFDPEIPEPQLIPGVGSPDPQTPIKYVRRPPLSEEAKAAIIGLGASVDKDGHLLRYLIPYLARLHFFHDVSCRDTYIWLIGIAKRTGSDAAVEVAETIAQKMIGEIPR